MFKRPSLLISDQANRTQGIFWWHLNFLILTFTFKIVDFAHFFCRFTANQAEIQKITTDSMFTTP